MWTNGTNYELYVGRWSRLVAKKFVAWLNLQSDLDWLDVGCGTGVLTQIILNTTSPKSVLGIDSSEKYIEFARKQVRDPRVSFHVGNARTLPVETASYDVVVCGLVLNFISQPDQTLREMVRAVRIGGTVAAYVWDYADYMQLIRYFWDAAIELDKTVQALDEGRLFPLCQPENLRQLFQTCTQLKDVEVRSIDVPTVFSDFEDYWSPLLGGQGPAPSYIMSLSEERRAVLKEYLRQRLPTDQYGSIRLVARAWAVRGFN